jgi:hypothetical protein
MDEQVPEKRQKQSGKLRKRKRRARRMLRDTRRYEKAGMHPDDAVLMKEQERAAPEPRDGELFTGPSSYIHEDIHRVRKLMGMGVFSPQQKDNMLRAIADLVENGRTEAIRVNAYRTIQHEIRLFAQLLGEIDVEDQYHVHLHSGQTAGQQLITKLERLLGDDTPGAGPDSAADQQGEAQGD